ncbi:MAG TPA: type II toxin-antitoxin system RelE/ParE family toxin [Ignavibacteria bacterium]|nr:type II toxin-antitoxin system RelE/ParE family toxin [Ignavibacteria bacterium]
MAKRVIWTEKALRDRFEIFRFWVENNKSNTYSIKLDSQFENLAVTLSKFPQAGKKPTELMFAYSFSNIILFFIRLSGKILLFNLYGIIGKIPVGLNLLRVIKIPQSYIYYVTKRPR